MIVRTPKGVKSWNIGPALKNKVLNFFPGSYLLARSNITVKGSDLLNSNQDLGLKLFCDLVPSMEFSLCGCPNSGSFRGSCEIGWECFPKQWMSNEREGTFSATNTFSRLALRSATKEGRNALSMGIFGFVGRCVLSWRNERMCEPCSAELKGFSLSSISGQAWPTPTEMMKWVRVLTAHSFLWARVLAWVKERRKGLRVGVRWMTYSHFFKGNGVMLTSSKQQKQQICWNQLLFTFPSAISSHCLVRSYDSPSGCPSWVVLSYWLEDFSNKDLNVQDTFLPLRESPSHGVPLTSFSMSLATHFWAPLSWPPVDE